MVTMAVREGFVVTAHFYEQLPLYEKQELSMQFYFPQLVSSINLRKEGQRLEGIPFYSKAPERIIRAPAPPPPPQLTGIDKLLEDAEESYRARNLEKAKEQFRTIAADASGKMERAKGYYGLARVATAEKDYELAEKLFGQGLELGLPPAERAWSLVHLGGLATGFGEDDAAEKYYNAAAGVEGAPDAALQGARQGLEKLRKPQ